MIVLGLTGGMGCGKSTAAGMFEELGFRRLDSDQVVREQILAEPEVIAAVVERYGSALLDERGLLRRGPLAARVFAHADELAWLEAELHPRLYSRWRNLLGESPESARWVFEVPLLFEKQLENWFDFIVCVTSTPENQFARLERRGIPRPQAEARISKQLPLMRKSELADFVISNDGSPAFLRRQVLILSRVLSDVA
jgi:dephospho-CoA kinase